MRKFQRSYICYYIICMTLPYLHVACIDLSSELGDSSFADILQNRRPATILKRGSNTGVFLRNFGIF